MPESTRRDRATPDGNLFVAGDRWSRLLARLGGPDPGRATARFGALGVAIVTLPPLLLAAWKGTAWGTAVQVPFLRDAAALARLVAVVPLLVVATWVVGSMLEQALAYLEETDLEEVEGREGLEAARRDLERRSRSRWILVWLALAAAGVHWLFLATTVGTTPGGPTTWILDAGGDPSPAGWWYLRISQPIISVLLLLWVWRYGAWVLFLRKLGRSRPRLQPAHPDRVGGLAPVARGHLSFLVPALVVNVVLAGELANRLLYAGETLGGIRTEVAFFTALAVAILAAPLVVFVRSLVEAKNRGVLLYGRMGFDLTAAFDERWMTSDAKLLDTADPSALADFSTDYELVRRLQVFPLGLRQMGFAAVALFLPFAALVLTQISVTELLRKLLAVAF